MKSAINPWKIPSSGPMLRISYGKLIHLRKLLDDNNIVKDDSNIVKDNNIMVKDNNNEVKDMKNMGIKTSKMLILKILRKCICQYRSLSGDLEFEL